MSRVHLISRGKKWALKVERGNRALKLFNRKPEAKQVGAWLYKTDTLIIHNTDGTVDKIIPNAGKLTAH